MLKPKDIHEVQFSRAFKGYDPDEVDKFLDQVTEDYTQLFRQNAELMNKLEVLAAKVSEFKNAEESLRAAREKIYRMAQEVASKAKAEAAQTEREAKERAERIVIEAKRDCEAQRRLYERLQLEVTRFKAKTIALFKSEIEQLNSLPDLQVDAKDELRIRADEISEEDTFSSPFVEEYKPKYVSPAQIDFGVTEAEEEKANEAAALKASADPKQDFTSDYIHHPSPENSMFSPVAHSGDTQEQVYTAPVPEPVAEEPVAQPVAEETVEPAPVQQEAAAPAEKTAQAEKPQEVKAFDVPEEPAQKPAFTVTRITVNEESGNGKDEDTVTAKEIADSLPEPETAAEGRMENGWYNETEEFDVVDTSSPASPSAPAPEREKAEEHPKFGQLRFGSDYDISEEDSGSRGFGFFRKKK